jgi:hypothetical protein
MDVFVSVYLPVKGWAMIVYGPEGPQYTGNGRATLVEALGDAIDESNSSEIPLDVHGLITCSSCGGIATQDEVCDCGFKSQLYLDHRAKFETAIAAIKARIALQSKS